jgi:pilus assembly protein Flp/PilA
MAIVASTPGPGNCPGREVIQPMLITRLITAVAAVIDRDDERGQGLAEYALILALIAIVAIIALIFLGSQISDKLSVVGGTLQSYQP